ncbi:copper-binding protein [Ralstonia sp. RL]|uniref:copper-binding protein n=1 Tax=Ralstonia sp. RL TaxID=1839756 RepID=UPI00257FF8DF|nr:copper-binding protein [Ralstonia sp. RL]
MSKHDMSQHDMSTHGSMGSMKSSDTAASMSSGEVKKIDKDAGKITIKHGPLTNLDMPAMTMVFKVKDPAMLDQVKVGDKIGFAAEKVNGAITVTKLEPAK